MLAGWNDIRPSEKERSVRDALSFVGLCILPTGRGVKNEEETGKPNVAAARAPKQTET